MKINIKNDAEPNNNLDGPNGLDIGLDPWPNEPTKIRIKLCLYFHDLFGHKMCHEIVGHCALLAMSYAVANRFWRVLLLFIAAEKLHKMEVLFFMTKMEVL